MKSLVLLAIVIIFAIPVSPKPSEAVGVVGAVGAAGPALNSTTHAPAGAEALEATELLNVTIGTEALENSEALNVTAGTEALGATETVNVTVTSEAPKDHAQHSSLKTTTAAIDSEENDNDDQDSSDESSEHHIDHRSVRAATTVSDSSDSSESEEEDDEDSDLNTVMGNVMSATEVVTKMCKFLRTKIMMVKSHAECSMQHPFWARQVRKYDSILASAHNSWLPSDRFGRIVTMPTSSHDIC